MQTFLKQGSPWAWEVLAEALKASSWEILFRAYKSCLSAHCNLEQMSVNRVCYFSRHRGLWKFSQEKNTNRQWKKWRLQTEIQMAEKPKACSLFQAWAYVFSGMKCDMHSQPLISSWESFICEGSIKYMGPYSKELTRDSEDTYDPQIIISWSFKASSSFFGQEQHLMP